MEPTSLTNFYNDLKKPDDAPAVNVYRVGNGPANPIGGMTPAALAFKHKVKNNCHKLKDKCCKHILLDIYCKILPLDKDYIDGNMGQMSSDIDGMLAAKGMTPTQYFTSCYESTNAHFIKYLLEQTDMIANSYMEKEDAELKDAQENNIDLPEPPEPDTNDEEINSQLVDVENDMEYDNFVEILKKKTIDKIVDDVSQVIAGEKEDKDMSFDPSPATESTVIVAMDYLQKSLWNESASPEQTETMLGLAIRESTLNQFDKVFNLRGKNFNEFATRVRLGKGYVINESTISNIK